MDHTRSLSSCFYSGLSSMFVTWSGGGKPDWTCSGWGERRMKSQLDPRLCLWLCAYRVLTLWEVIPMSSPSHGGDVLAYVFWHKPTELAYSFLFCSCVCFCLYGPLNCISFHIFSQQLSAFSLSSSSLISAILALSTVYLFMKVSLSPDVILCDWLGLKHQLTNYN